MDTDIKDKIIVSGGLVSNNDGGYVKYPSGVNVSGYVYPYLFLGLTLVGGVLGFVVSKKYNQKTLNMLALVAAGLMGGSAIAMKTNPPVKIPE